MPSSYTASLRLTLQATGESINLWGDVWNAGVGVLVDYSLAGWLTKALTGNYTLTTANGSTDEARAAMLKFTGGAGPFVVTIPSVSKKYSVWNACTGAVTLTTGAGSTVTIDGGDIAEITCDGSNVKTPGVGGLSFKDYVIATAWTYNAGALPAQIGNAGKVVTTDGTTASWVQLTSAYLSDTAARDLAALARTVALAVAL